jgi:hypothetical protein
MDPLKPRTPDPQWDLTLEIARALELEGSYEAAVEMSDAQRVVDIRWAAHQASRLLGVKTRVVLTPPVEKSDPLGTATVTSIHADSVERNRAQDGIRTLMRTVRREQIKTLTRATVPAPRRQLPAMVTTHIAVR